LNQCERILPAKIVIDRRMLTPLRGNQAEVHS
jgi:hypothetical protein